MSKKGSSSKRKRRRERKERNTSDEKKRERIDFEERIKRGIWNETKTKNLSGM